MNNKSKIFMNNVKKVLSELKPEAKLQLECVKWFRQNFQKSIIFYVKNEEKNGLVRYINKCLGTENGIPDLCIIHKGKTFFCELKAGTKLSPEQETIHEKLKSSNLDVYVIKNIETFKKIFENE